MMRGVTAVRAWQTQRRSSDRILPSQQPGDVGTEAGVRPKHVPVTELQMVSADAVDTSHTTALPASSTEASRWPHDSAVPYAAGSGLQAILTILELCTPLSTATMLVVPTCKRTPWSDHTTPLERRWTSLDAHQPRLETLQRN